jgi:hypothetical protein
MQYTETVLLLAAGGNVVVFCPAGVYAIRAIITLNGFAKFKLQEVGLYDQRNFPDVTETAIFFYGCRVAKDNIWFRSRLIYID